MNDPHHVYLDLDVINNNEDNKVVPTLRFEEIRNTPFLDGDSSEYFCSIVRSSIQTGNSLPVFIPKIKLGQPDPNLTIYTVKLAWTNTYDYSGTRNVIYRSDLWAQPPQPPLDKQDLSGSYYYVHNYGHFINLVNKARADCLTDLKTNLGRTAYWQMFNHLS